MNRRDFQDALDTLLNTHDVMICAQIDAAACRTTGDWRKADEKAQQFQEAREEFLSLMYPEASSPQVFGWEVHERDTGTGAGRGRPKKWCRGVRVFFLVGDIIYTFYADAADLAWEGAVFDESGKPYPNSFEAAEFDPLKTGHALVFNGFDYRSSDDGPAHLRKRAIEALRGIARWMHNDGVTLWSLRSDVVIEKREAT